MTVVTIPPRDSQMRNALLSLTFSCLAVSASRAAEPAIQPGDTLPLERCIAIALENDPDLKGKAYSAEAAGARVEQARAGFLPTAAVKAAYVKNEAVSRNTADPYSNINTYDMKSAGITANQLLFDFGKANASYKSSQAGLASAKADRESLAVDIVNGVRRAYYQVLNARRTRELREAMVAQYQQHLSAAQIQLTAGTKPKYDVIRAQTDLSSAQLELIKADNGLQIARAQLSNAMNLPGAPAFEIVDNLSFSKYETALDAILNAAYARRQDLQSLAAQAEALERDLRYAKSDLYPALYASAGYDFAGSRSPLSQGWNAGANLSMDVFSGFRKAAKVRESENNVLAAKTRLESLKLKISLDAQQAFLNLGQAGKAIETATLQVAQAQENFDIVNARYSAGISSPVEVTDSLVLLSNARLNLISALYDYKVAQADIEKTMGNR